MPANLCLWDCQHNLHADKNMIQYCQCRIGLSNDIVMKKWNSTPAEELSISITVGSKEFEVTCWNTFNVFFSCIKWIKSEWMRYFRLPSTMQKQTDFLFPKEKNNKNNAWIFQNSWRIIFIIHLESWGCQKTHKWSKAFSHSDAGIETTAEGDDGDVSSWSTQDGGLGQWGTVVIVWPRKLCQTVQEVVVSVLPLEAKN